MDRGSYWSLKVRWNLRARNKLVTQPTELCHILCNLESGCEAVLTVNSLWKLQRSSNSVWFWSYLVWQKLGAAGFKTVFSCCCSIRGTVIEGTLAECTPVIGIIPWLDFRQLFSTTILLCNLEGVRFCLPLWVSRRVFADHSWLSRYPLVLIWTWEGPKFCLSVCIRCSTMLDALLVVIGGENEFNDFIFLIYFEIF